jgi:hypothetical protein
LPAFAGEVETFQLHDSGQTADASGVATLAVCVASIGKGIKD